MRKERLQQVMQRKGHNPASLAEMVGISERNIWRLLNKDANTSDETITALAQTLEVSSDYLLGLSDDPTPHMRVDNLTDEERRVLQAIRRGERMEAIRIITASSGK